ncbi:MAG: IPT/TIG domain-containing protein [Methanoregula sp.]
MTAPGAFTVTPGPVITSISPASGYTGTTVPVTINGANFQNGATVWLQYDDGGDLSLQNPVVSSDGTTITGNIVIPGDYSYIDAFDVVIYNPDGGECTAPGAFQVLVPGTPVVDSISPNSGTAGTLVTIEGSGFIGASEVDFGEDSPATNLNVVDDNTITVNVPPGTGTVDVTVTNATIGTSATSSADKFTYVGSAPVVSSIFPNGGPLAGGNTVTISGSGFTGATLVGFGGTAATSFIINGDTYITATVPAASAGTVNVNVTTPLGTSLLNPPEDQYTYLPPPTVTAISPTSGSTGGGTVVTITGTNFNWQPLTVNFSTNSATNVVVNSATQITATSPPGTTGTVDVTVTNATIGTSAPSPADQFSYGTPIQQAVNTVQTAESGSGHDTTKEAFYTPVLEPGNTVITDFNGKTITLPSTPGYLVYVDQQPNANWEHPLKYYYLNANDLSVAGTYTDNAPATNIQFTWNSGKMPNVGGVTSIGTIGNDPTPLPSDGTHNYALLISGAISPTYNYARYYNDIKFMYTSLNQTYHYPKDHITVLLSDGSSTTNDQVISNGPAPTYAPIMGTSPNIFDSGTVNEVYGAATYANVKSILTTKYSKLGSSDSLFIFTTGHGGWDGVEQSPKTNNNVWLYLWSPDQITPAQFDSLLPMNVGNITVMMEQCYGGGFVGPFISSAGTQTRVIETAANGDQSSNSNYFSYPWISGVNWADSAGNPIYAADVNPADGKVSMNEAFTYATTTDPAATAGVETPQLSASSGSGTPFGVNQFLSAYTTTTQSITVNTPTASTVWTPGVQTITWTQANLPTGTNVVVNLMKKSSSAVQASISGTVSATTGTVSYTVPSSMPLGAATDYYVQVSTTGVTPPVMGTSPTFSISGVTTQATGTLTVNSNVTGAQISIAGITDTMNPLPVTPKTFSGEPALTYLVQLSANGYYPNSASVKVTAGRTIISSVPLSPVINGDNTPYGEIIVNSNPEGANVFIDGNNIGLTPSDTHIMPGPHKVYVSEDGYQTSAVQSVTIASYSPGLDRTYNLAFTLTPMKTVMTTDLILPNPLNLADTNGYFVAFVLLPKGYQAANVDPTSVYCDGAPATRLVRTKLFPSVFVAIFQRNALVGVSPGNKVTMEVDGVIDQTGGNALFSGSQVIKVINQKPTSKEDIDKVGQLSDNDVYKNYYPW